MSAAVTVSADYRISIPEDVRKEMGIRPGEKVTFIRVGDSYRFVRLRSLEELRGSLAGAAEFVREKQDRPL